MLLARQDLSTFVLREHFQIGVEILPEIDNGTLPVLPGYGRLPKM